MPHVSIKLHSGRPEALKQSLADEITRAVMHILGSSSDAISVAVEDIQPEAWKEKVYLPEIKPRLGTLYKKPGYRY